MSSITKTIQINPIYAQYFPGKEGENTNKDWSAFNSKVEDLCGSISTKEREVDFSMDTRTWKDTLWKVSRWALNIAVAVGACYAMNQRGYIYSLLAQHTPSSSILAAGIVIIIAYKVCELARYIISRLIMIPLYPLQSHFLRFYMGNLDEYRSKINEEKEGPEKKVYRHVILERDGIRYSGLLIGHEKSIGNGKWVLQATANAEPIEASYSMFSQAYAKVNLKFDGDPDHNCADGYNTLMINGPHCVLSEGHATPKTMGEVQELGLEFLETAIKAERIVMAGRSLGGFAIGEAILLHNFKPHINYLAIRQMSFDRISNVTSKWIDLIIGQLNPAFKDKKHKFLNAIKWLIKAVGLEGDCVAASKKLQEKNIHEVIIQGAKTKNPKSEDDFERDGPIHERASLGRRLFKEGMTDNKTFIGLVDEYHMTNYAAYKATKAITKWDQQL